MIKLNYTLTVYFNTGFNGIDIPANASVLETASKKTYTDTYYLREDIDAPQIIVNDNYHNLSNVDYVKLTASGLKPNNQPTTFFYFASPKPYAGGTTCLTLDLDALLTCGGASELDYTSGWQERGHIAQADDTLFGNLAPEAWSPKECLRSAGYQEINPTPVYNSDLQVVISNIDLVALGKEDDEIKVIEGKIADPTDPTQLGETVMYLPKIKISENPTVFGMQVSSSRLDSLEIPHTTAFRANDSDVKKGLDYLLSCGQLQLQNSYTIPRQYIDSLNPTDTDGRISTIIGIGENITASNFPFEYTENGYTPKNKKCYATFRDFTLVNLASSAMISKKPHETEYNQGTAPNIRIWADMTSTGKPFARFMSDASPNLNFVDCIQGSQWVNHQILLEGASGALWNNINAAFSQQSIDRDIRMTDADRAVTNALYQNALGENDIQQRQRRFNTVGQLFGAGAGAMANPVGAGAGIASGIGNTMFAEKLNEFALGNMAIGNQMANFQSDMSLDKLRQAKNENQVGLLKANGIIAPTSIFTPEPNLAMYGYNKFVLYETRKSNVDLRSEDMYYQRYGYNGIHRPLTKACFNCRQYYTYVQAFDVNIKTTLSIGMRIKSKAIEQLNNGVRVWKVLPDAQYYETN